MHRDFEIMQEEVVRAIRRYAERQEHVGADSPAVEQGLALVMHFLGRARETSLSQIR